MLCGECLLEDPIPHLARKGCLWPTASGTGDLPESLGVSEEKQVHPWSLEMAEALADALTVALGQSLSQRYPAK